MRTFKLTGILILICHNSHKLLVHNCFRFHKHNIHTTIQPSLLLFFNLKEQLILQRKIANFIQIDCNSFIQLILFSSFSRWQLVKFFIAKVLLTKASLTTTLRWLAKRHLSLIF